MSATKLAQRCHARPQRYPDSRWVSVLPRR
jgi:hypothetical protein